MAMALFRKKRIVRGMLHRPAGIACVSLSVNRTDARMARALWPVLVRPNGRSDAGSVEASVKQNVTRGGKGSTLAVSLMPRCASGSWPPGNRGNRDG